MSKPIPNHLLRKLNPVAWLQYNTVGEQTAARLGHRLATLLLDEKDIRVFAWSYAFNHAQGKRHRHTKLEVAFLAGAGIQP